MKKFQATTLRNATVYSIPWGGAGAALEGKGTLFLLPGRIRVAVFPGKTATCIVTELRFNDDERMNKAGYDLIERSLKFSR